MNYKNLWKIRIVLALSETLIILFVPWLFRTTFIFIETYGVFYYYLSGEGNLFGSYIYYPIFRTSTELIGFIILLSFTPVLMIISSIEVRKSIQENRKINKSIFTGANFSHIYVNIFLLLLLSVHWFGSFNMYGQPPFPLSLSPCLIFFLPVYLVLILISFKSLYAKDIEIQNDKIEKRNIAIFESSKELKEQIKTEGVFNKDFLIHDFQIDPDKFTKIYPPLFKDILLNGFLTPQEPFNDVPDEREEGTKKISYEKIFDLEVTLKPLSCIFLITYFIASAFASKEVRLVIAFIIIGVMITLGVYIGIKKRKISIEILPEVLDQIKELGLIKSSYFRDKYDLSFDSLKKLINKIPKKSLPRLY